MCVCVCKGARSRAHNPAHMIGRVVTRRDKPSPEHEGRQTAARPSRRAHAPLRPRLRSLCMPEPPSSPSLLRRPRRSRKRAVSNAVHARAAELDGIGRHRFVASRTAAAPARAAEGSAPAPPRPLQRGARPPPTVALRRGARLFVRPAKRRRHGNDSDSGPLPLPGAARCAAEGATAGGPALPRWAIAILPRPARRPRPWSVTCCAAPGLRTASTRAGAQTRAAQAPPAAAGKRTRLFPAVQRGRLFPAVQRALAQALQAPPAAAGRRTRRRRPGRGGRGGARRRRRRRRGRGGAARRRPR